MEIKELESLTNRLAEEFDSVLILVTKNEEGVTRSCIKRRGNYYASMGLVRHYLDEESQQELADWISIKQANKD